MTALESSKNKVNGFKVGGVDYITKPILLHGYFLETKVFFANLNY
jgi:DNA-binding response OmpR family regulator